MPWLDRLTENLRQRALAAAAGPDWAALLEGLQRAAARESLQPIDLAGLVLAVDDLGWQKLGGPQADNGNDFLPVDRVQMVRRSRLYWNRDPLVKQAVRLYTAYALGQGVDLHHPDKGAQAYLDAFFADPLNAKLWGPLGRRRTSNKLLVDGELFTAVIGANDKRPQARLIDPLQITALITNPDDADDVWYVRREHPSGPEGRAAVTYYPLADAAWGGEDEATAQAALPRGQAEDIRAHRAEDVVVLHAAINTLGVRGYPLVTAGLDWSKASRVFMEDRATITHTGAQILWKKTVRGGQAAVDALGQAQRSGTPMPGGNQNPNYDRRGPIAGSTWLGNQSIDLEQMPWDNGSANAIHDARLFRLMFLASVGFSENYFGDATTGNRATATAMERPIELTLLEFQETFTQIMLALGRAVLAVGGYDADGLTCETPPILNVDKPAMLTALTTLANQVPAMNNEVIWREILALLGVEDPDADLKLIKATPPPAARATGLPVGAPPPGGSGPPAAGSAAPPIGNKSPAPENPLTLPAVRNGAGGSHG